MNAIVALDAHELSAAIHARRVSCREVMSAYLAHIAQHNPAINAIVSLRDADELLRDADECDRELARGASRGWMHGFPHAVKDLVATRGIRTTLGSPIFAQNVPTADAITVERIKAAGAIIIGKTNTSEFGLGSHTYNDVFGRTLNPYDATKTAGGSSGGAGAALAMRLVPLADGSDFSGSLRNPAAYNNVFGLRPTFGRVPGGPAPEAFLSQLGTDGPMARTAADTLAFLRVLAGPDPRMPLSSRDDSRDLDRPLEIDLRGKRIGWLADLGGAVPIEPDVLALGEAACKTFESLGCIVEPASLGVSIDELWNTWRTHRHFISGGRLQPHYDNPAERPLMKPEAQWEVEQGRKIDAITLFQASKARTAWHHKLRSLFTRYDALMTPSAQLMPFDVTLDWPKRINGVTMDCYLRWMQIVTPFTLAGMPALGFPVGFNARGLPMGMQLVGAPFDELGLLRLAHAYDRSKEWVRTRLPAQLMEMQR